MPQIHHENATDFLNGLGILVRIVTRGNDQLRLSALHVRTPVRHDTVGGLRSVASAPVTNDRVIWDTRRDRNLVDRYHEAVCRRKGIHAVGYAFELQLPRSEGNDFKHLPAGLEERDR